MHVHVNGSNAVGCLVYFRNFMHVLSWVETKIMGQRMCGVVGGGVLG